MKLTDWIRGMEKPVRVGVYQRMYYYGKNSNVQYCYWNGEAWGMGEHTVEQAMMHKEAFMLAPRQHLPWRGVYESNS